MQSVTLKPGLCRSFDNGGVSFHIQWEICNHLNNWPMDVQSLWGNGNLHCSWMVRCCEILFCQSTIVRGFLIGTEGGRQGEGDVGRQGRRILLSLGEFMFDSWHTVLLLFWKYTKFATDWYVTWPSIETFIFQPHRDMLSWRGFSVGFEHMVLIFFWKYIEFAIDWYIIWPHLGNLIFHPMESPRALFCTDRIFLLILSIWFSYFSETTYWLVDAIIYDYIRELWFFTLWGAPRSAFLPPGAYPQLCFDYLPYFFLIILV